MGLSWLCLMFILQWDFSSFYRLLSLAGSCPNLACTFALLYCLFAMRQSSLSLTTLVSTYFSFACWKLWGLYTRPPFPGRFLRNPRNGRNGLEFLDSRNHIEIEVFTVPHVFHMESTQNYSQNCTFWKLPQNSTWNFAFISILGITWSESTWPLQNSMEFHVNSVEFCGISHILHGVYKNI